MKSVKLPCCLMPLLAAGLLVRSHAHALPAPARHKKATIRVAFTIDDLPAVGEPPAGWTRGRILSRIVDTLKKHHITQAVGFFNGSNMDAEPDTRAALESWLQAGFVLGNHTFAHDSVEQIGALNYERDIERNRSVISDLVGADGHVSHYFRYPYLERGHGADERSVRHYLLGHEYRIADVSVDFDDWAFSAAYVRCTNHGDEQAKSALRESYLSVALAELYWSVDTLRKLVGKSVPQVLLVHANFMTSEVLDALLTEYEAAGVEFVALSQALENAAYARAQTARHGDASLVEALERERHAHLHEFVPVPRRLLDVMCL
jgi:peptidoglycan/xylan/chitin deacetylase (PgdA/CDA1 family)